MPHGERFHVGGRLADLEEQALRSDPISSEMNMPIEVLMERLATIPEYKPLFATAFPGTGLSPKTLAAAIATYERTVVPSRLRSTSDRGKRAGNFRRGKAGFCHLQHQGQCSTCHEGWNFTNDGFQDIGLASADVGGGSSCLASSR